MTVECCSRPEAAHVSQRLLDEGSLPWCVSHPQNDIHNQAQIRCKELGQPVSRGILRQTLVWPIYAQRHGALMQIHQGHVVILMVVIILILDVLFVLAGIWICGRRRRARCGLSLHERSQRLKRSSPFHLLRYRSRRRRQEEEGHGTLLLRIAAALTPFHPGETFSASQRHVIFVLLSWKHTLYVLGLLIGR